MGAGGVQRRAWLLALGLVTVAAQVRSEAGSLGAYFSVQEQAWSQGLPVLAMQGDWQRGYQPRAGDQRASASARAETGVAWFAPGPWGGGMPTAANASADPAAGPLPLAWRLGGLARADGTAELSGQAAQILYHYQSRTNPTEATALDARTRLQYWVGRGMTLHTPAWGVVRGLSVALGWDHLRLSRFRRLDTDGQVAYDPAQDAYQFQGTLHDDNVKESSPFLAPAASQGAGDAWSVAVQAQPAEWGLSGGAWPSRVSWHVQDAWSRLTWAGLNVNDAVLDSNVTQRTPEGYIAYTAAIHGQLSRRTVVARIPAQHSAAVDWLRPEGRWQVQAVYRLGLWQRWLNWEGGGDTWRVRLGAEPVAHAWQLGLGWRGLQATAQASRTDQAAHVRGVSLSWVFPL